MTTVENMFNGATSFNCDLDDWAMSSVTTFSFMLKTNAVSCRKSLGFLPRYLRARKRYTFGPLGATMVRTLVWPFAKSLRIIQIRKPWDSPAPS